MKQKVYEVGLIYKTRLTRCGLCKWSRDPNPNTHIFLYKIILVYKSLLFHFFLFIIFKSVCIRQYFLYSVV